jgi:hypothetical protein
MAGHVCFLNRDLSSGRRIMPRLPGPCNHFSALASISNASSPVLPSRMARLAIFLCTLLRQIVPQGDPHKSCQMRKAEWERDLAGSLNASQMILRAAGMAIAMLQTPSMTQRLPALILEKDG